MNKIIDLAPFKMDRISETPYHLQLVNEIVLRIEKGSLSAGMRLPVLKDLALWSGISENTVRRALDDLSRRGYIEKRRRTGIFVRNPSANHSFRANLEPGNPARREVTGAVAIMFDESYLSTNGMPKQSWPLETMQSFELNMSHRGYTCRVLGLDTAVERLTATQRDNLSQYAAFFILLQAKSSRFLIHDISSLGKPLVVHNYYGHAKVNRINDDWEWGMQEVLAHLHHAGHSRIALMSFSGSAEPNRNLDWIVEREQAFLNIAPYAGVTTGEKDIFRVGYTDAPLRRSPDFFDKAKMLLKDLLQRQTPYTALVAVNDRLALTLMEVAEHMGLKIPGDFSMVGFDNIPAAAPKGLSTVTRNTFADGLAAAEILIEQQRDPDKKQLVNVINKPQLLLRQTIAPVG
jgi:DNA-binding LacI/PurR family transcriptional regulator